MLIDVEVIFRRTSSFEVEKADQCTTTEDGNWLYIVKDDTNWLIPREEIWRVEAKVSEGAVLPSEDSYA